MFHDEDFKEFKKSIKTKEGKFGGGKKFAHKEDTAMVKLALYKILETN